MELKPGYKQTEVGVIPEDWEDTALVDVCWFQEGPGVRTHQFREAGVKLLNGTNITNGRIDLDTTTRYISNDEAYGAYRHFLVDEGDILLATSGITIEKLNEKVAFAGSDSLPLCMNTSTVRFKPLKGRLLDRYLYFFLQSDSFRDQIGRQATGSAQLNFGPYHLNRVVISVPKDIPEQRAIAAALSDVDALITALDQLIAKKRDLKQAVMQQLLTGQQRLPGFHDEWEQVKAGDIGQFRGGSGFPIKFQGATAGEYPFFKVSDMNNPGNETFMETANNFISEQLRRQLGAAAFPAESIVFAKVGAAVFLERKKILRRASCLDNNMAAFVMNADRADYRFVHYMLLNTNLGRLVSTTALPSLSGSVLSGIELPLPPVPEQNAIAAVLSDIDAELQALEQRRDKTVALKQGMMQELLTGRIRLV